MKEKDHLLVVEGAVVVEGGEGLERRMGMDMQLLSMRMEVGIGIVVMRGAGVEEEVVTSVAVEEEGTMVLRLITSKMQDITTRKVLLQAVVLLRIIALCFYMISLIASRFCAQLLDQSFLTLPDQSITSRL
ncbi:uncharacterized protein LOC114256791 [Camellia sinensis]|uniref:uncharacterized protein LOC114256791 n=1 Tax=Camellia sinensis TaxID=4442 RepID=UPI001035F5AA|nr:uncharacterized protein LOC114256791 [Camellia sinensis]